MIKVPIMNYGNQNPVGMIVQSMLTEVQFQEANGLSWVLSDGRSVVGSQYAAITGSSTIPDLRGMILRGKNNGRADGNQDTAGERSLGSYQADQMPSHSHSQTASNATGGSRTVARVEFGGGNSDVGVANITSNAGAGTETRPKNIAVNHFIKINP